MVIFFTFSPTSNHLHPLQVVNCDSNSRLVVDEDDNGKFRPERVKIRKCNTLSESLTLITLKYFCKNHGGQTWKGFSIWNHHKWHSRREVVRREWRESIWMPCTYGGGGGASWNLQSTLRSAHSIMSGITLIESLCHTCGRDDFIMINEWPGENVTTWEMLFTNFDIRRSNMIVYWDTESNDFCKVSKQDRLPIWYVSVTK